MKRPTIAGLQRAQAANAETIAALRPSGALGRAVQWATATAHRYAVGLNPVDTGAWRASHRMQVAGTRGRIFLETGARNPRSGTPVTQYAGVWEARAGRYAIYKRTRDEAGPTIAASAAKQFLEGLP